MVGALVVGALVVGALVVGALVVGALVVGALVVGALEVGTLVVGAMIGASVGSSLSSRNLIPCLMAFSSICPLARTRMERRRAICSFMIRVPVGFG